MLNAKHGSIIDKVVRKMVHDCGNSFFEWLVCELDYKNDNCCTIVGIVEGEILVVVHNNFFNCWVRSWDFNLNCGVILTFIVAYGKRSGGNCRKLKCLGYCCRASIDGIVPLQRALYGRPV